MLLRWLKSDAYLQIVHSSGLASARSLHSRQEAREDCHHGQMNAAADERSGRGDERTDDVAIDEAAVETHTKWYAGDICSKGNRTLGGFWSEQRARQSFLCHLRNSSYHHLSKDEAGQLVCPLCPGLLTENESLKGMVEGFKISVRGYQANTDAQSKKIVALEEDIIELETAYQTLSDASGEPTNKVVLEKEQLQNSYNELSKRFENTKSMLDGTTFLQEESMRKIQDLEYEVKSKASRLATKALRLATKVSRSAMETF